MPYTDSAHHLSHTHVVYFRFALCVNENERKGKVCFSDFFFALLLNLFAYFFITLFTSSCHGLRRRSLICLQRNHNEHWHFMFIIFVFFPIASDFMKRNHALKNNKHIKINDNWNMKNAWHESERKSIKKELGMSWASSRIFSAFDCVAFRWEHRTSERI